MEVSEVKAFSFATQKLQIRDICKHTEQFFIAMYDFVQLQLPFSSKISDAPRINCTRIYNYNSITLYFENSTRLEEVGRIQSITRCKSDYQKLKSNSGLRKGETKFLIQASKHYLFVLMSSSYIGNF